MLCAAAKPFLSLKLPHQTFVSSITMSNIFFLQSAQLVAMLPCRFRQQKRAISGREKVTLAKLQECRYGQQRRCFLSSSSSSSTRTSRSEWQGA
jgi:hypothetical protein